MPYKYKDPYRHKFEDAKYKVTNWHEYNQALIERGNITIWFDEKAIKSWMGCSMCLSVLKQNTLEKRCSEFCFAKSLIS